MADGAQRGFDVRDILPWLTAVAIVGGAIFGVAEMRSSTGAVAIEIRHLATAVTKLSGELERQKDELKTVSIAVAAIPRAEAEVRELRTRMERLERRIPSFVRPRVTDADD